MPKLLLTSIFAIIISLIITSCEQNNNNEAAILKLEKILVEQKADLNELKKEILEISAQLYKMKIEKFSTQVATFNPDNKEFQIIQTSLGMFFIQIDNIQPYGNGYKVFVSIGNPNFATFSNINIKITYGKSDKNGNFDLLSAHNYKTTLLKNLLPGFWNNESFILAPAEKEDLQNIWIHIEPTQTALKILPKSTEGE